MLFHVWPNIVLISVSKNDKVVSRKYYWYIALKKNSTRNGFLNKYFRNRSYNESYIGLFGSCWVSYKSKCKTEFLTRIMFVEQLFSFAWMKVCARFVLGLIYVCFIIIMQRQKGRNSFGYCIRFYVTYESAVEEAANSLYVCAW